MKTIVVIAIIVLLICFMPIIPYEKPLTTGCVTIENKTISSWAVERYKEIETQQILEHRTNQ